VEHAVRSILVIDVGGNHVKVGRSPDDEPRKIPSGPTMTAREMVRQVRAATADWKYDVVSVGYPGPVHDNRPVAEPFNLGRGWVAFDYEKAFGKPVRMVNDAAMQALGSYEGGRMLFLGLGTGLGSALIVSGVLAPLELAHLPYRKGRTYEDYAGEAGQKRLGRKKWVKHVLKIVELLGAALQVDYVVLGGGEARKLTKLPAMVRLGDNANAMRGGFRLWERPRRPSR
jgi:polyphosphate glucokinase